MDPLKLIAVSMCFLVGFDFLKAGLEPFPQKSELLFLEGKISDVSQCNHPIKGYQFKTVTLTGTDGRSIEFKRGCVDETEKLTELDINKPATAHYKKDYDYFIFPEIDVFNLIVDGKTYTDYDYRKSRQMKPLLYILAFLFIFWGFRTLKQKPNKRIKADA